MPRSVIKLITNKNPRRSDSPCLEPKRFATQSFGLFNRVPLLDSCLNSAKRCCWDCHDISAALRVA